MDYNGVFGPVGLLTDDVDELQDALDGVHCGDAVIRPRGVVQVEDVLAFIDLQGETKIEQPLVFDCEPRAGSKLVLTYPSLNFLTVHSGDSDTESISTLISPYITGSSVKGQ